MAREKWSSGVLSIQAGIKADEARVRELFKEAKALYAPGGEYMKGIETQLARGRTRAVAGGMQSLAAAGLAGTSIAGGLSKKYEEEVAAPAMAQATTARLGALSGLLAQEAGAELQLSMRPPITIGGGGGGGGRMPVPQQRRRITQPTQPAQPAQRPQQLPPSLNLASQPTAPGGYGTYYGKAFYERQKQPQAPAPVTSPLSSFYGGNISGGSLMQQADPYNISGRYF